MTKLHDESKVTVDVASGGRGEAREEDEGRVAHACIVAALDAHRGCTSSLHGTTAGPTLPPEYSPYLMYTF